MVSSEDVQRVRNATWCTSLTALTFGLRLSGYRGRGDGEWRGRGNGEGNFTISRQSRRLTRSLQVSAVEEMGMKVTVAGGGGEVIFFVSWK